MINMDMIGRIREGKVYLGGTGTGSTFNKLLEDIKAPPRSASSFRENRIRRQRPHFVHDQTSTGTFPVFRTAWRLSQTQRHGR
jgi:hypothetical protein